MLRKVVPITFLFLYICAISNGSVLDEYVKNGVRYKTTYSNGEVISAAYVMNHLGNNLDLASYARLCAEGNSTGWNRLRTWTNIMYTESASHSVGHNEGSATAELIAQHWYNTIEKFCAGQENICKEIRNFIKINTNWINKMVDAQYVTSDFWYQVKLIYSQIDGLAEGYQVVQSHLAPSLPPIPKEDFILMNMLGDLNDLVEKFQPKESLPIKLLEEGHGTALVKLVSGNKDLITGHTTSGKYSSMVRVAKRYELHYEALAHTMTEVQNGNISFSGYPGMVYSGDEFYVLKNGLAVQKTSIINNNKNLWKFVKPENTVFGFVRIMVANRLARNAESWTQLFSQYNSGTSNGQYVIVDYKKFTEGQPLKDGALWVLEQIPGTIKAEDLTNELKKSSYWASYNIPYFKNIYELSGYDKLAKKYGSWFSYTNTPRAKIIRRDHKSIKCCCGMMTLLRSNNYKKDPFSKCKCKPGGYSASIAVAPRKDLNSPKGNYPIPFLGHYPGGAIDAKLVTSKLVLDQKFKAISGPTIGKHLPVFKWSSSDFDKTVRHLGQANEWNFKAIEFDWIDLPPPTNVIA